MIFSHVDCGMNHKSQDMTHCHNAHLYSLKTYTYSFSMQRVQSTADR